MLFFTLYISTAECYEYVQPGACWSLKYRPYIKYEEIAHEAYLSCDWYYLWLINIQINGQYDNCKSKKRFH